MWTFNSIQITVIDLKDNNEQILAKLQPVNGGTIIQTFGYINEVTSLQCLVVGSGDLNSLKALYNTGNSYALVGPDGPHGNYYVDKVESQWMTAYRQTFRPDKSDIDYIFRVGLDLTKA